LKIIIAGDWLHPMYENSWSDSFKKSGNEVIKFSFLNLNTTKLVKFEVKYSLPLFNIFSLNRKLYSIVVTEKPQILLIWLGTQILPSTLRKIRNQTNTKIISYIHDDPFSHLYSKNSPWHHKYYWRTLLKGLKYYNLNCFSKNLNVMESYNYGSKNSIVLRQFFSPSLHKPLELTYDEKMIYECEVAFAGHYENDGRDIYIKHLVDNGIKVNLYGDTSWDFIDFSNWSKNFKKLPRMSGNDYTKALNGAFFCLCFMSKLNRDKYTTRCFEIPACASILVAERTTELENIYRENEEVILFTEKKELLDKIKYLLNNKYLIEKMSQLGYQKVYRNKDDVDSRTSKLIELYNTI
jgi:spore maturation protein CgeB